MAVIDTTLQVKDLYTNTGPHEIRLVAVNKVSTGDTMDVSAWFSKVQTAVFVSLTSQSGGLPSVGGGGTILTFGQSGLNNDTGILVLVGGWA